MMSINPTRIDLRGSSHAKPPDRTMLSITSFRRRRQMMPALTKVLWRTTGADVDIEDLKIVLIFCGAGLLLSLLAAMTYGLGSGLF